MNLSDIKKPIAVIIAATSLVATYVYFANMTAVIPPLIDSALPASTARPTEQDMENLAVLPDETPLLSEVKSSRVLERALPTKAKQNIREDIQSDLERELILAEENGFGQEIQFDTSAPPPTTDNMTATPTGEYADQIDQQSILEQAEADGLLEVDRHGNYIGNWGG
jgi:hypothetical protein